MGIYKEKMNIGFYIPYASVNYSAGIQAQGHIWAEGLRTIGHHTFLLNNWDKFDYESMDCIIILGGGGLYYDYIHLLKSRYKHIKIIGAPIIDSDNLRKYVFRCKYVGSEKFHIHRLQHDFYICRDLVDIYLARSEYEKHFIVEGFNVSPDKVHVVPLSMGFNRAPETIDYNSKENFCLHVSRLSAKSKNVEGLVKAAIKYNFQLHLGGFVTQSERKWLNKIIDNHDNIKYLGYLSEESLKEQYLKAKVFALPSFLEGVGLVALDAAVNGCEIVLTNIGGPKEYYDGRAVLVNPYSVDSIGNGVIEAMTNKSAQPELRDYILNTYSMNRCIKLLEKVLVGCFIK